MLQVRGVDFKVQPLKLDSVRPFLLDTVTLSDGDLQPDDKDEVERFLEQEVGRHAARASGRGSRVVTIVACCCCRCSS